MGLTLLAEVATEAPWYSIAGMGALLIAAVVALFKKQNESTALIVGLVREVVSALGTFTAAQQENTNLLKEMRDEIRESRRG